MNNKKTVLIIDEDPKNKEILVGGLINSQFQVITADNGHDGLEKARQMLPDLILVDMEVSDLGGLEFLERLKVEQKMADLPVVLLTTREDGPDRLRAYEYGAKDYIVKPLHVSEIVAKVRIILSRLERRQNELVAGTEKISGSLREKNLLDLIDEISAQGLTGVLVIVSPFGRKGQVYFSEGHVVHATLGNFSGERAVYQMVSWSDGQYDMAVQDIDVDRTITIGNLDLVLQSKKRLERRRKLVVELPSPDVHFKLSDTFLRIIENREMSEEIVQFIEMFDGNRGLQQVLAESAQDELVTLERVVKMHEQGFLTVVEKPEVPVEEASPEPVEEASPEVIEESGSEEAEESGSEEVEEPLSEVAEEASSSESEEEEDVAEKQVKPEVEPALNEKEFEIFHKRVAGVLDNKRRVLVVVGTANSGKSEFIQALAEGSHSTRSIKNIFPNPIDIGKVKVSNDLELTLIGTPVEKRLGIFVDSVEENMLGYIMLINAVEPESFDYLGYLIKSFRSQYHLPYAIAITNLRHPQAPGIEALTQELGLESFEEAVPCNPSDANNVKMVFLSLYSPYGNREAMQLSANMSEYN